MMLVLGAALVGCGVSGGNGSTGSGNGSAGTGAQVKTLSVAEQFVATNAKTNSELNLVALKYLNNGTEVAMFYEPSPGTVMFSVAGSPVVRSVLNHALVEGKTASELWELVSPGESVPEALAQAIERSKNPALISQSRAANPAPETPAQASDLSSNLAAVNEARMAENAQLGGGQVSAPSPAVQTNGENLLSGGYCSNGGFFNDWGSLGSGAAFRHVTEQNFGWIQDGAWNNWSFTGHAQFAACPTGDVSNTGGQLAVTWPHGSTQTWWLNPNFFQVSPWVLPATSLNNGTFNNGDYNCGWDSCCGHGFQFGGTRCTPTGSIANGKFSSACFLNHGSSCGDHFWWIGYATVNGPSYCQDGQASCPCSAPNDCTGA
jgi:hypothetical protein